MSMPNEWRFITLSFVSSELSRQQNLVRCVPERVHSSLGRGACTCLGSCLLTCIYTYMFVCRYSYVLLGAGDLLCGDSGQWSQPVPFCEPISECTTSPPDVSGSVYITSNVC